MLRFVWLTLLLIPFPLSGQTQTALTPELQIIRFDWRKYEPGSLGLETGVSKAGDRNSPDTGKIDTQLDVLRDNNKEAAAELEKQKQLQLQKERSRLHTDTSPLHGKGYKYSLETKNTSPKRVAELFWDYVFIDPRTEQEALRHHFGSKVTIKPGKSAKVAIYSTATPYLVVDAKQTRQPKNEQVVIKRIVYADGSTWEVR